MKQKGFILISMLFMMVLLAVTAITLNRRAGLQARMASNQISSIQTALGQSAATEKVIWELTKDPMWRTAAGGENYTYNGTTYNRKVLSASVAGYTDAVTATVTAPGAANGASTAFRYYLVDFLALVRPYHVFSDAWDNIYLADYSNHSVIKVDSQTGAMTRVAGTGTSGYDSGEDGGPATSARLDTPTGVWVDASGMIYIADRNNNRIRRVDLAGTITTVAGNGTYGYSGDTGQATSAMLRNPTGIYGDAAGNLYIADTYNHRVRKVDTSGIIDTVAGNGTPGYVNGPIATAQLNSPRGVYVEADGSVFYIADTLNHRIRKVDAGIITLFAGDGTSGYDSGDDGDAATNASLNAPRSVVKDSAGNLYIGDYGNHAIRIVDTDGDIDTVAGTGTAGYDPLQDGGPATSAQLDSPAGVGLTSAGNLIIGDTMNSCLREVASGNISTLTAKGDPGFSKPSHIAMDSSGNVYIADKNNHRIRKLDTAGKVTTVAGTGTAGISGDGGLATSAQLKMPEGVDVDTSGNIYIADKDNCRIRKVDAATQVISLVAGKPGASATCTYDGEGNADAKSLKKPHAVFVDASDNLYIADTDNHRIRKVVASTGVMSTVAGNGTAGYSGDGGAATSAQLNKPKGVAVDSSGNIYIADTDNHVIRKVNTSGNISTVAGIGGSRGYSGDGWAATSAQLDKPVDVFVDANGNLFIADHENHVIRVVSVHDNKIIHTLAGTGASGYDAGDQPAIDVRLNKPAGITMAATRGGMKIYLSDRDNNRIRTLEFRIAKKLY